MENTNKEGWERKMEESINFIKGLSEKNPNETQQIYYETAQQNEEIFRNILKDLKENKDKRPIGFIIPEDFDYESNLEKIFEKYSQGERFGQFTINDFTKQKNIAQISYENSAQLSGVGACLEYKIHKNNSVEFNKKISTWMS